MKASCLLSSFAGLAVLAVNPAGGEEMTKQQPAALPKRTPGLWRITTVSPEIGMQTNVVCIEDGDSIIGEPDSRCGAPSVTRANDQVIVTIECGPEGERDVTSLLFTGDFTTWYRAQSKATVGASRSGFTIDAKLVDSRCKR